MIQSCGQYTSKLPLSVISLPAEAGIFGRGLAEITAQWWERERLKFDLFTSELVIAEAAGGDEDAAKRHLDRLREIPALAIDDRHSSWRPN